MSKDAPTWAANRHLWQAIVNSVAIPSRHLQRDLAPKVPVRARLVWERDGQQMIETTCGIWAPTESGPVVHVWLRGDRRAQVKWCWLRVGDTVR